MSIPTLLRAGRQHNARPAILAALLLAVLLALPGSTARAQDPAAPAASGWNLVKFPQGQPLCSGLGFQGAVYYDRLDCGFGYVSVTGPTAASVVKVQILDGLGFVRSTQTTSYRAEDDAWEFSITPAAAWQPGLITLRVSEVDGQAGNFGETNIYLNQLGATVAVAESNLPPGSPVTAVGTLYEVDQVPPLAAPNRTNVGATFYLQVRTPAGDVRGPYGPYAANALTGAFSATLPGAATAGVSATQETGFQVDLSVEVVNASYSDPATGLWAAERAGGGAVTIVVPPDSLLIETSFVSSLGWVKPGESYPFRVAVKNFTFSPAANALVTIPAVDGTTFNQVVPLSGSGSAAVNGDGSITWTIGALAAGSPGSPVVKTLVVEAQADAAGQDPQIVWKDLSSTATLSYDGGPAGLSAMSHGPKVIPPASAFDTARYGDRPFPVVPVDYFDRKHQENHTGDALSAKVNSPAIPGSTFNLFQEISLGQLFPHGAVPSSGIASAGWEYAPDFAFSALQPQGTCSGFTFKDFAGTAVLPERIVNGWYQLPGTTHYYGADRFGSALPGALLGVGPLLDIDSACGPTGKAVYDAAQIADPEIDYNDFDTDKDGLVDFFMMVFVGAGGNGASQTEVPPYDNIWPHSTSLEFYFTDAETGLKGYISDDQLKSQAEVPQCWTSAAYAQFDDCAANGGTGLDALPVYVRVGPYNVNPETAIDRASVISHEYGHSLGLPDFYSTGDRSTYGDWNLMATDKSHFMDIFGRQELGWIVPVPLNPGETRTVSDWRDSKLDTGEIHWQQPDGAPYTLSAANGHQNVHNTEAYVAKLPPRLLIDPAIVANGASPDHVWWSGSGNDFGCPPAGGHNLDVFLPELANFAPGTPVSVEFASLWNIEWDFDYGFVMVSTDGGATYQSVASANGYTTPQAQNPTANACQAQFGNGLTGTTKSYQDGTQEVDRLAGIYPEPDGFVPDSYDISFAAGSQTVLRFSYATDPGLAKPGWFIDNLTVSAGGAVIYQTDFEAGSEDPRLFNGGCQGDTAVAESCTDGWTYVSSAAGSPADHAYYLEMRDRSSFDLDGKGENDRDPIAFEPGLLLVITDEAHGYGNTGVSNPPAQSPVDSQPEPGVDIPNLDDAAFKQGDNYSDSGPAGWVDNYSDPDDPQGADAWRHLFDCLTFSVDALSGASNGPATAPGDLTGDVTFSLGAGCAAFDYGHAGGDDDPDPPADVAGRATGGGWLLTNEGKKLNFSFDVERAADGGLSGQVKLHDKGQAKVELTELTAMTEPSAACDMAAGPKAVQLQGNGTFNGAAGASFRVCLSDQAEPGAGADRLLLECLAGCSYSSAGRVPDDVIDGGNLQVAVEVSGDGGGGDGAPPEPATATLDPILLAEGAPGQLQLFTVTVYDQNQAVLAGASVSLSRVAADGSVETLTALADLAGVATFSLINLSQTAEYIASAGAIQSNAVEVSPLLP
ncbi:MAG: post-COAP-1 domain-containing protein [Candidatus Promineifilaceae bacterium]